MSPTVRIDAPLDPSSRMPLDPILRGLPVAYTATASDPDSDSVSLQWARVPNACAPGFDAQASWPTSGWKPGQELDLQAADTTATFCVWVKATDRYGATAVDALTGDPQDRAPVASLELVSPANAPAFPVRTQFVLSAERSSDPDPGDTLSFSWTLKSSPSQTAALLPCPGNASDAVRCLMADAAGDYQVEVRVADDAMMSAIIDKTLHVLPGQLPVAAIDLVSPLGAGPYPLGAAFKISGAHSTGGDPTLAFDWAALEPAMGSTALLGDCDGASASDERCFTADVPGTYRVTLGVHNETGPSPTVSASYVVAPDQPPCIDITTPDVAQPITTAHDFVVDLVSDDLDPFPATTGMGAGMQWFVSQDGGAFAPVEKDFPSFSFNPAAFSFGDVVRVRLEIHDRDTDRGAKEFLACGDADVCSAPSLVHPDACLQRVTWTVHILP